uniref:Penicillin-binding protein activator LpoB n=1 Tax=candidate division WOR-3 bacterium TaxID=2052148 RepID=A0A7C4CAH1_UNCW3
MKPRPNAARVLPALLMLTAGCFTAGQLQTMRHVAQPYSISPNFDLSRPWRIAVLPPPLSSDVAPADFLAERAGLQLMKVPMISVVDRAEVERILQEQQFSYSGVVDPATAVKLGKLMGAAAVATIKVGEVKHDEFWTDSPEQRDAQLFFRIISVETAEVLYSAEGQGSSFSGAKEALSAALDMALLPLLEKGIGK